jgi:hypothetical protein
LHKPKAENVINTLVLTERAIAPLLFAEGLQADWFNTFAVKGELTAAVAGTVAMIAHRSDDMNGRVAVIRLRGDGGVFDSMDQALWLDAFKRTLRVLLSRFDQTISIPREWKSYFHQQMKYLSFQAAKRGSNFHGRIHVADIVESNSRVLFVYYCGDKDVTRENVEHYRGDLAHALRAVRGFSAQPAAHSQPAGRSGEFVLEIEDQDSTTNAVHGLPAADWLNLKFTARQREFVNYDSSRSARIVGPAGTGKTLAMAVKCVLQIQKPDAAGLRIGFLSHSNATARFIKDLLLSLDRTLLESPDNDSVILADSGAELQVATLFGLASNALKFDLQGLSPVSEDAFEGREVQLEAIRAVVQEFRTGDWAIYRDRCSRPVREYVDMEVGSPQAKFFEYELMNEFACVLDAEGASTTTAHRDKYLQRERRAWMMPLDEAADRQIVWNVYVRFRRFLAEMNAIGVDQLIADYVRYLDSFAWNAKRASQGYDRLYVDELHLFNRQERDAITLLGRNVEREPTMVVAYDNKQSPRDTFVGVSAGQADQFNLWRHESVTSAKKFEVSEVFRYSPEIVAFLASLDSQFPLLGLGEEWTNSEAVSRQPSGDKPSITVVADVPCQYKLAFQRAADRVRKLRSGKRVAMLCCNPERFQIYCDTGEFRDRIFPVKSREDAARIQYAGKRFIVSMPEYVAGLQFDTVFMVDVNDDEVLDAPGNAGAKRRFLSNVYLGASRAERRLELFALRDSGGMSRFLRPSTQGDEPPLELLEMSDS